MKEHARDFQTHESIEQSFEPVTRTTKASTNAITKELIPIKEEIEKKECKLNAKHSTTSNKKAGRRKI